jgi:hypothetical protein
VRIGDRILTAEVIHEDEDTSYVTLLVLACVVEPDKNHPHKSLAVGIKKQIRRRRSTLEKGRPERMLWTDESARAALFARRGTGKSVSYDTEA